MNKKITPLQAFEELFGGVMFSSKDIDFDKLYTIVETALKENKTLKKLYKVELKNTSYYNNLALKYKKALEIVKKKKVNVQALFYSSSCEDYNKHYNHYEDLTQEEYDLLKEVLK